MASSLFFDAGVGKVWCCRQLLVPGRRAILYFRKFLVLGRSECGGRQDQSSALESFDFRVRRDSQTAAKPLRDGLETTSVRAEAIISDMPLKTRDCLLRYVEIAVCFDIPLGAKTSVNNNLKWSSSKVY